VLKHQGTFTTPAICLNGDIAGDEDAPFLRAIFWKDDDIRP
jgi:hypothetical protein